MSHEIDLILWSLTGPLVLDKNGQTWASTLPPWIREHVQMDRMLALMTAARDKQPPLASDLDALAYLYPATLMAPLTSDWTNIYLRLGQDCLRRYNPFQYTAEQFTEFEGALESRPLSHWEHDQLRDLKRSILTASLRHLKRPHRPPTNGVAHSPAATLSSTLPIIYEQLPLFSKETYVEAEQS